MDVQQIQQFPLISVLMTAYNRAKYIAEAIESVLASTYTNFELIIVDDCSNDNTVRIAKDFEMRDKRIKLYVNEKNIDQFPNRNKAAGYAHGELIMCVDSDDTIRQDAIEYVVVQFNRHPNAKFSTLYGHKDISEPVCIPSDVCINRHFYVKPILHVGPGGTVIRADYFKEIGGFPTGYGAAGDTYYNVKAACGSEVLLLPYIYYNYRVHGNQELNNPYAYLYNGYRYFEDMMQLPELPLTVKQKEELLKKNKRRFLVNCFNYLSATGNLSKTIKAFKIAGVGFREIWTGIFL